MKARHFVFLRRAPADAAALGRALGMSRADADRIAKARVPQPVAVCGSGDEALAELSRLRDAGLDAFTISGEEFARFSPARLRRAEPAAGGVLWTGPDGPFILGPDDVRMIVLARIRDELRFEGRLADDYVEASAAEELGALFLFRSAEKAWRAVQGDADLVRLIQGPPPPNSAQSFLAAVRAVRGCHPGARFDDTLYKAPASMRSLGSASAAWMDGGDLGTSTTSASSSEASAVRLAYVRYLQAFGGE